MSVLTVISLGAGVQSSTMALMAAHGELTPMPDCAIFADTGSEPKSVYSWLERLAGWLPFPIAHVRAKRLLREESTTLRLSKNKIQYARAALPAHIVSPDGRVGIMMRQCTTDQKIRPIQAFIRVLLKEREREHCNQWIGISLDEVSRMSDSRLAYISNQYPLVFDAHFRRDDCLRWMEQNGYPKPPRSACTFCPYRSNAEWERLKTDEPEEFASAVAYEREYQETYRQIPTVFGTPWLHRSLKPLDEVDFRSADEKSGQSNLFENECSGMCGV